MTSIEDRVRAAAHAAAAQVRDVRPLDLPDAPPSRHPAHRLRRGWVVPLTAAATVVVVALSIVIAYRAHTGPASGTGASPAASAFGKPTTSVIPACGGRPVPVTPAQPATVTIPAGVPEYFVELCFPSKQVIAANTRTGQVLSSFLLSRLKEGPTYPEIYAASDDRTFLMTGGAAAGTTGTALYVIRLAPGTAHPVTLTRLPWTLPGTAFSMALSPDGTQVAVAQDEAAPGPAVRVYRLATGAVLHSWTASFMVDYITWSGDGRSLAFDENGPVYAIRAIATPGSDLSTGARVLATITDNASGSGLICGLTWEVSADGRTLICPVNTLPIAGVPSAELNSPEPAPVEFVYRGDITFTARGITYIGRPESPRASYPKTPPPGVIVKKIGKVTYWCLPALKGARVEKLPAGGLKPGRPVIASPAPRPASGASATASRGATGCPKGQLAFQRYAPGARLPYGHAVSTAFSVMACPYQQDTGNMSLWWASADGTTVIGAITVPASSSSPEQTATGVFSDGTFVPLPALGNVDPDFGKVAF
jgi:hypothetical protein